MIHRVLFLISCSVLLVPAPASARHYRASGHWENSAQHSPYYSMNEEWGSTGYYRAPRQARRYSGGHYRRASWHWDYSSQYIGQAGWDWNDSAQYSRPASRHKRHAARHYRSESHAWGYSASGNSLVDEMRRHIGTNPTGWSRAWCGHYLDAALRRTGHKGGGNLARAYAHYGRRVHGPVVGAIAVMARRGGGHVGVVSGVDPRGNPIVVSGNHGRRVAESVYPRSRVYAYVIPE